MPTELQCLSWSLYSLYSLYTSYFILFILFYSSVYSSPMALPSSFNLFWPVYTCKCLSQLNTLQQSITMWMNLSKLKNRISFINQNFPFATLEFLSGRWHKCKISHQWFKFLVNLNGFFWSSFLYNMYSSNIKIKHFIIMIEDSTEKHGEQANSCHYLYSYF